MTDSVGTTAGDPANYHWSSWGLRGFQLPVPGGHLDRSNGRVPRRLNLGHLHSRHLGLFRRLRLAEARIAQGASGEASWDDGIAGRTAARFHARFFTDLARRFWHGARIKRSRRLGQIANLI
jgi:hypothetical protein